MTDWAIPETSLKEVPGFQISWLPAAAYKYVQPRLKEMPDGSSTVELKTEWYVGMLPLNNGDTLSVIPRAGRDALIRMQLATEGLASSTQRVFDDLARIGYTPTGTASWAALLARSYFQQLRIIEKGSLRSERVRVRRQRNSAKGKVLAAPTMIALARRASLPVHCTFKESTFGTLEHRILGAGAQALINLRVVDEENQRLAYRWARHFRERLSAVELQRVLAGLRSEKYTGSRSYYIEALLMARLLLVEAGVAVGNADIAGESVLLNIRTLFERYVRATLHSALSPLGYIVEKREVNLFTLFQDGTGTMKPDVLISDGSGIKLVMDAKYKLDEPVAEPDYYQMAAYLNAYKVNKGVLVFPSLALQPTIVARKTQSRQVIYELRLPLTDWSLTEQTLVAETRNLLQ